MWESCSLDFCQLRAKKAKPQEYIQLGQSLRQHNPRMRLIANDFAKEAVENTEIFSGLHLGQEDLKGLEETTKEKLIEKSRKKEGFILGLSTHNSKQIQRAVETPFCWDYLALGPCFPTLSKRKNLSPVLDIQTFNHAVQEMYIFAKKEIKKMKSKTPDGISQENPLGLVFIGGIQTQNISSLLQKIQFLPRPLPFSAVIAAIQAVKAKQDLLVLKEAMSFL